MKQRGLGVMDTLSDTYGTTAHSAIRSLEITHHDSFARSVRNERKRVSLKSPVRGLLGNWHSYCDGYR